MIDRPWCPLLVQTGIAEDAEASVTLLIAEVSGRRLAFGLEDVQEVQAAVRIAPLPGSPAPVEGLVDLRGRPVAVIDGHRLFGGVPRGIALSDRLVFVHSGDRVVAIRVDRVDDIVTVPVADVPPAPSSTSLRLRAAGVARLPDGLVVIHDAGALLSADESDLVDVALALAEADKAARHG